MNKLISIFKLLGCFLALFNGSSVIAQTPNHYVNYTGGDNYIPFNFMYNKVQWLYFPSEFTNVVPLQAGNITKVYVKASSAANATLPSINIKLGTTSLTSFTSGPWVAGLTTVMTAANYSQVSSIGQWVAYTLQTPYYYDGVSNLVLEIEVTPINAGGYNVYQGSPGGNRRLYGIVGNATSTGTDGTQAAIGFDMSSNCTGMPSAGVITKSANQIVCGNSATATLTSYTMSNGIRKQWQYSSDRVNWTNGDTSTSYTINNVQSKVYVRAIVTCTHSSMSATTAIDSFVMTPIPVNLGVDTHLCQNDSIMLQVNANNVSSVNWQNNTLGTTFKVQQPGTYSARVLFSNGCVSNDTIEIRAGILPVNPLAATYSLCEDSVITLNALNTNMKYLWNNVDTNQIINPRQAGNYSLRVTSRDQCIRNYSTQLIERPLPIVTIPQEVLICIGEPLALNGTAVNGDKYWWNGVLQGPILNVIDSGLYHLQVRSEYGCLAEQYCQVIYKPNPTIEGFSFIPNLYNNINTVSFRLINPQTTDRVLWTFGDGDSSTMFNPTHVYDSIGTYLVQVFLQNNCNTTEYNQVINLVPTSLGQVNSLNKISIFPNPTQGKLNLVNDGGSKINQVKVYDVLGRIVVAESMQQTTTLDLSHLPAGQYHILITLDNSTSEMQTVIKH